MNWRTVDLSRESRRDQFAYFQTLSNPYVGVTVQVDVTGRRSSGRNLGKCCLPILASAVL